ncbi:PAP/fibrillin family protein [Oscillatoria sp. CS-180]|uniref:PAP/fibrillin family protein n=1 Tax=Oscillatoria sp. CS-180 TaxID=3021720 RepID=UPI00232D0622|nr:PAP/fibrillin family protein [Oscillatoria sp. CS-180]MDB9524417.1 PAP/fibrillin family protein [Oscillatoria sp. CS-180]
MLGKTELLEAIASTNRGLLASDTDRQAIQSLIARLEDRSPHVQPLEATEQLNGVWRLLYTNSRDLLGIDNIPFYKLGQIYQCVYLNEARIYNVAEVVGLPQLEGLVSVAARFEAVSQKRVNVAFERAVLGLQRLLGYRNPGSFIQTLQLQGKLPFWQGIDFQINSDRQSGWLEITYLDDDLRIGRGNQGSLFVLRKVP